MYSSFLRPFVILFIAVLSLSAGSCQSAPNGDQLKPEAFKQKLDGMSNEVVLDVRTPEEYAEGHLEGAMNVDWQGDNFEQGVSALDKSKPVFVYCLAGVRSAAAAKHLRGMGFKEVYDMEGGMLKWRAAGLPEAGAKAKAIGMTIQEFEALLNTDKTVLVDFYATWCGPCKKMEPYLAEIAKEKATTVNVVRIDADANPQLAMELKVTALPTIFIYKKQELQWHNVGYTSKASLVEKLNAVK